MWFGGSLACGHLLAAGSAAKLRVQRCQKRRELLLRLRDDENREIGPDAFLPVAERYGLLPQTDRWVLAATCRWLAASFLSPTDSAHSSIRL